MADPKVLISELTTDPAPALASMLLPLTRAGLTRKITGTVLADLIIAYLKTVDGSGSGLDADLLDGQSSAFYLPAGSYTAADVLAKIKAVDGAGSGLDADLLDGISSAGFLQTSAIGSTVQAQDPQLAALASLAPANNQLPIFSGLTTARLMALLGTVAQSGGVPTGDLFQYTANVNGISIRFPFNLQLCFGYDATGLDCTTVQGGGFVQSAAGAWSFPQTFTTTWQGFGAAFSTNQVRVGSQGSWTTSSLAYGNKAFTSSGTPVPLGLFAVGPWY